ncbi:MAG: GGDEF domain-containing protein [Oscillospiraceae bacterium]|nr:GGDEF domain-containing protein [Oscillospiraceae bacterium]
MKIRKRLAVVMSGISNHSYQHQMLEGIIRQAFALDYDVAIFTPFLCYDNLTDYQKGENKIFDLINYQMFDAVLYIPCAFYNDTVRGYVEPALEVSPIPVIAVESDDKRFHCVQMDDRGAFRRVTEHLIEKHGLSDILCLTGFKDNYQAEERVKGYLDAMKRHGLDVPEDHIVYGDFWIFKAQELAEELGNGRRPMPQGIVCACDNAAVALCNRLIELGVRVPEDVLIASYDAGPLSADNVPSITSYMRPIMDMGMRGVLKAHELLTGEICEPVMQDHGYLIPAESCGCGEDFQQKFAKRQRELKNIEHFRSLFEDTPMAEHLNTAVHLQQLLHMIMAFFYLINGLEQFYLCLNEDWDDPSKNSDNPSDWNDYTDMMHLRIFKASADPSPEYNMVPDLRFPRSDLLPVFHEDREHPVALYFTPLHFNERCFGYAAIGYGQKAMAFDSLYHAWTRNVNNALEFMRIRNSLNSMNQQLFLSSIRDTLTGIYNRSGFMHFAKKIFRRAQESKDSMKLLVMAADLDLLKHINDNFGHAEGDNALIVSANALNTCFEYGEVCARTGGDEFLVIGCAAYTRTIIEEYFEYIERFLDRYNLDSGKPYPVGVSLGYVCESASPDKSLQDYIDEADARMYANKVQRRKLRTE